MRHLLTAFAGAVVLVALFMNVDWPSLAAEIEVDEKDDVRPDDARSLRIDTMMYAAGHSFGFHGDVTMWGGWYFDTIPVGDDNMLSFDSVGSSLLKLSLVSRELLVDLGDSMAPEKIRDFLRPRDGFKRFRQNYEEVLDSIVDEDYTLICTGYYSFTADYADSCTQDAALINRFLCDLTGISKSETAKVPGLSAFYAGFNPRKIYRPVYTGDAGNMKGLSDFMADKAFENWKRSGDTDWSSNAAKLDIRIHVCNPKYVTFGIYEQERIGLGHGMYSESFSSLDLSSGKTLSNRDIFKPNSLDKVKKLLFETMFDDRHYMSWNEGVESPDEIEQRIVGWQLPSEVLEGTV